MDRIAAGVVRFQNEVFADRRDHFEQLADGQKPRALFITCSDSRLDPNLLTQTQPGELFICRNAGNIVPPHTNYTGGMTASIEFAVGALNVPNIIVCGHTQCGAMEWALDPDALAEFPHVREWLAHARAASLIVREQGALSREDRLQSLIRENVLLQVAHLKTHPYVAARLATKRTVIHAWVYDIRAGAVVAWNEQAARFIPVAEHYGVPVQNTQKTMGDRHGRQKDDG